MAKRKLKITVKCAECGFQRTIAFNPEEETVEVVKKLANCTENKCPSCGQEEYKYYVRVEGVHI